MPHVQLSSEILRIIHNSTTEEINKDNNTIEPQQQQQQQQEEEEKRKQEQERPLTREDLQESINVLNLEIEQAEVCVSLCLFL